MAFRIQLAPVRNFNDLIGIFSMPVLNQLTNRLTNNLLYYQTNYMLLFAIKFILLSIVHPTQFFVVFVGFLILFSGLLVFNNKNEKFQLLKRNKPYSNLLIIISISGLVFNLFDSLIEFVSTICIPFILIFIHASLRQRNIVNKSEKILGFRTPMGWLLEKLGAINEIAS